MEFPNYVVVFLWAPWLIHNLACGTAMDKCLGLQAGVVNAQFLKLSGGSAMWCSRQETTKPGVRYPPRGNNMVRDFFLRIFLNEVNILLNSGFRYWQYCKPYIQMQFGIHWVPDTRTHTHTQRECRLVFEASLLSIMFISQDSPFTLLWALQPQKWKIRMVNSGHTKEGGSKKV